MTEVALPLPLPTQDEFLCRRCDVHCEKVVYPSACMERSCPFAYAYEEHGHRFMGCMQKIFEAEIDIEMMSKIERRHDGFGAVRATRRPLPMCRSEVDPCYEHRSGELGCVNPEFKELPAGSPTFRVIARLGDGSPGAALPRVGRPPRTRMQAATTSRRSLQMPA